MKGQNIAFSIFATEQDNSRVHRVFLLLNLRQCSVPLHVVNQIPVHLGVDPHAHAQL